MNIQYLGSVRLKNFNKNELSDPLIAKRAKHVITENERVLKAKELLIQNNINEFGKLMNESHLSYSKDFDASTEDVDKITKRSIESELVLFMTFESKGYFFDTPLPLKIFNKSYEVKSSFSFLLTIIECFCTAGPLFAGWKIVAPDKTDCDVIL